MCHKLFEPVRRHHNARNTCSDECHLNKRRLKLRLSYYRTTGGKPRPNVPKITLSERDLGYIAGMIDGEGWIGITIRRRAWKHSKRPHYHRPMVAISQVRRGPLDYIAKVLRYKDMAFKAEGGHWTLRFHPPCLRWLLPQVRSMLQLKRRQADILLKFMSECRYTGKELTDRQYAIRERLRRDIQKLNIKPNATERPK